MYSIHTCFDSHIYYTLYSLHLIVTYNIIHIVQTIADAAWSSVQVDIIAVSVFVLFNLTLTNIEVRLYVCGTKVAESVSVSVALSLMKSVCI